VAAASVARALLRGAGIEVVARRPRNYPRLRRPLLMAEEQITLALDVGANRGQWARELRDGGYLGRIVSFEPGSEAFSQLDRAAGNDRSWECRPLAIGASTGPATLYVSANSVSSSLLHHSERQLSAEPRSAVVRTETVELQRLDGIHDLARDDDRILLKADVEGAEIDVLMGAAGLLDRTRLLELELSAVPLHEGQPLLGEVVRWCELAGFVLTGIEVSYRDRLTGDLFSANGFFRRT